MIFANGSTIMQEGTGALHIYDDPKRIIEDAGHQVRYFDEAKNGAAV